tara:strand:+ start:1294 stop:1860 length:567 start_codon:yes stop_codon:yes gene_type:complete
MTNYFAILDLPETLILNQEQVAEAWHSKTQSSHPDATQSEGATENTAAVNQARAALSDPAHRLEHWLSLKAGQTSTDRTIDPGLMDLFTELHAILENADSVIQRNRKASTALAKALLSKEAIAAQLGLQAKMQNIQVMKNTITDQFAAFETEGGNGVFDNAGRNLGQLKFLRKWEQQSQDRLLSLLEC